VTTRSLPGRNAIATLPPEVLAWALRHFVAVVAVLGLAGFTWINAGHLADPPIRSDGYSYYVYLPAWFLHGDFTLSSIADECCAGTFFDFTGIRQWPGTRRWVNPHPMGVAVQMAPFFVAAHLLTRWSNLPADGYSLYYQICAGLAGLTALLVGLAVLRSLLLRHYSPGVVLATLVTITWGTNAFHYGVYDPVFSHVFSFALIAGLLALTERWWAAPSWHLSIALAVVSALIVLTRHTNGVFLFVVPLYGMTSSCRLVAELGHRARKLAVMAAVGAVVVSPQFIFYKWATGHWVVSPYALVAHFAFSSPHLYDVLFGVTKGLFFWSPALLMAVAGRVIGVGFASRFRLAALLSFAVTTYLVASWSDWQFGASFGHRAFTDSLPVAALFVAAFYQRVTAYPRVVPAVAVFGTLCVVLCAGQMLQYWLGILPTSDMTWQQYRHLFLRFS
jgi:hypothetical protein